MLIDLYECSFMADALGIKYTSIIRKSVFTSTEREKQFFFVKFSIKCNHIRHDRNNIMWLQICIINLVVCQPD